MSHNLEIGRIGEEVACKFLMKRGFRISGRNYWKKCGEIDIVAEKAGVIHFVEVKAVTWDGVIRETGADGEYRPEDNVHYPKMQRMRRVIQVYLLEKNVSDETDWQFDVVTVRLDLKKREAKVEMIDNVIL